MRTNDGADVPATALASPVAVIVALPLGRWPPQAATRQRLPSRWQAAPQASPAPPQPPTPACGQCPAQGVLVVGSNGLCDIGRPVRPSWGAGRAALPGKPFPAKSSGPPAVV